MFANSDRQVVAHYQADDDIPMSPGFTSPIQPAFASMVPPKAPATPSSNITLLTDVTTPQTPGAANKGKTKPRPARRKPTTLLLSPHAHRRISPASAKTLSANSRRERIYNQQPAASRPALVATSSPSPTRRVPSGGSVRFDTTPPKVVPRYASPSVSRHRHPALKKAASPNPKAQSLGVARVQKALTLRVLGRKLQFGAMVLRPLKRGLRAVQGERGQSRASGNGSEGGAAADVVASGGQEEPLHGFALAQSQAMGMGEMGRGEDTDNLLLRDQDIFLGGGSDDEYDGDDEEPYSPMPISPLAHFMGGSTPNILSYRETSLAPGNDNDPFHGGSFFSTSNSNNAFGVQNPLGPRLNHFRSLTALGGEPDTIPVQPVVVMDDEFRPLSDPFTPPPSAKPDEDTEMLGAAPPLSPVSSSAASFNLSPVSVSSSFKRARSRGKAMRILGYEVHEAYGGKAFATALGDGAGISKRSRKGKNPDIGGSGGSHSVGGLISPAGRRMRLGIMRAGGGSGIRRWV